jgi:hypothetical protein
MCDPLKAEEEIGRWTKVIVGTHYWLRHYCDHMGR